jgi:hypothetical protein
MISSLSVYSIAPKLHAKPELVCQLDNVSADEAIEKLSKAGALAIEDESSHSITILGYNKTLAQSIDAFKLHGLAHGSWSRSLCRMLKRVNS